jgi:hypothetical protein
MNRLSAKIESSVAGRVGSDQSRQEVLRPVANPQSEGSESLPLSLSVEMRVSFYQNLLAYIKEVAGNEITISKSFKSELASMLEGFARVLRDEAEPEKTQANREEVEELKADLSKAKDKIICLLDEKTKDKIKITTLETQLQFMPDLQAQADRAISLVDEADTIHDELSRMRFEINKAHMARMRSALHRRRKNRTWWSKLRQHFSGSIN